MLEGLILASTGSERDELLSVVRSVRNRWRLRVLLRGAALVMLSAMTLLLLAGWVIDVFRFDATTVTIVRVAAWAIFTTLLLRVLILPLFRRVSDGRVALYLEEHEPSLEGRVISAVEFENHDAAMTSRALVERIVWRGGRGGRRCRPIAVARPCVWGCS